MDQDKKKFMSIGQIDATGVRGPHEKELEDIGKVKVPLFINLDTHRLEEIVRNELGGKLENIGFNEDWTITKEMFPEANIHMAYSYYGDEFGDDLEAEFKFYFSGERISWIPGVDSATFIDILMDFLERKIKDKEPFEKSYDTKTELMRKVLEQRKEPFKYLQEHDRDPLASFLGARIWKTTEGWRIKKEVFPQIFIELTWYQKDGLNINYSGEKLHENIGSYHVELVGIFLINHVLRYITVNNEDKELPDICYMMFSRYFTKLKNWTYRTRMT